MTTKTWMPMALLMALAVPGWTQVPAAPAPPSTPLLGVEQPDAQRTRARLTYLLQRYPPELRSVLSLDPSLLSNQGYLAPYPDLVSFLNANPEIVRNPSFYIGPPFNRGKDQETESVEAWRDDIQGLEFLTGFAVAFGLIAWLIRALMDHRRWNRLNKVQTEVHTRLLERLNGNEELLAYIQSPAGSKFLESAPIALDAGPQSAGAPLGRILWTVQAGVVIATVGCGLLIVAARTTDEATRPLQAFGTLGIALGAGFLISAILSFMISRRLGLVEIPSHTRE